jgi:hypothetical protein
MFYLNHFLKAILNFKVSGVLFVIFTIGLITATHNRKTIKKVFSLNGKTTTSPYFNALISNDSNLAGIARKMRKLPGVKNVRIKKALEVSKEIKGLQAELDSDVLKSLSAINYSSVTIELSAAIQTRSQNLIKEYLTRLVGESSITMSNVKKPKVRKLKKNSPEVILHKWGDKYIIALLTILWLASCLSFANYLKNYSFLIEKFQRKKRVDLKIFISGIVFLFLATLGVNLYLAPKVQVAEISYLIIALALSVLIFSKKNEFKKFV